MATDDNDLAQQVRAFDRLLGATGLRRAQVASECSRDVREQALPNAWHAGIAEVLQHPEPERLP